MDWRTEGLSEEEQTFLTGVRTASSLSAVAELLGVPDEHEAYLEARERWKQLREGRLEPPAAIDGVPGDVVEIDEHEFWVHGITHADTDAERSFLRGAVRGFLDDGAAVYCEQGIRPMYFGDIDGICEMDAYRWALRECQRHDFDSHIQELFNDEFETVSEQVTAVASRFREQTFSWIDAGEELYGERIVQVLGDLASGWVTTHSDLATGRTFEAFSRREAAATDPRNLSELQQYYRLVFLPQALEREWLRGHDPELEIVTHARNERMADYVVYHNDTAERVHLIVGAAHQPGVVEYLQAHRDHGRVVDSFEFA